MAALSNRIMSALRPDQAEGAPEKCALFAQLPVFSRQQAVLKHKIGAGWCYPFSVAGEQGYLWLLPDKVSNGQQQPDFIQSHWQCGFGEFTLLDGAAVISLLSHCPLPPTGSSQWYWSLFNQYLSPQLALLLGELTPVSAADNEATLQLTLQVDLGGQQAGCQIKISEETLTLWLAQPGFQPRLNPWSGTLPLSFPLTLAWMGLTPSQLGQLTCGSILVPQQPLFTPSGEGSLVLAHQQIQVEWHQPQRLLVTQVEKMCMSNVENEHEAAQLKVSGTECCAIQPELADLPLNLQLRCGRITLSLSELQHLSVGSLLTATGLTPGHATLCHGEHPLAEGELVNIEGQLGLSITRLYRSEPQNSDEAAS